MDDPRLDRTVELHFRGDWGQANFHRICGWLAQEVGDRSPAGSTFAIWSGRGGADQLEALRAGTCDVTVATPVPWLRMLHRSGELDGLACLGVIPQRDRLVAVADASLGVTTVADLASVGRRLTIATSPDDGVNAIGLAVHKALLLAGLDPAAFDFRYHERPFPPIAEFAAGAADVLVHEAVMTPPWQRIADRRPVSYLSWGDTVLDTFGAEGWDRAVVTAGWFPGLDHDLPTLDFSDFAVLCRADLPDDVAHLVTWCMVRTRRALEGQYAHIPPDQSPVTYPLRPAAMADTPLPLHPAARRAYDELGDEEFTDEGAMPTWSR